MDVDVAEFDVLLAAADRARDDGDAETAVTNLRRALGLWRGAPFGEFADREWATIERRRLEERRAGGWEDLIDAELAHGRRHAVIAELEPIVVAEPFHEPRLGATRTRVVSLQPASRCAPGHSARPHRVDRELGVDPGPGLKQLERRILDQDGSLLLDGDEPEVATARSPTLAPFAATGVPGSRNGLGEDSVALVVPERVLPTSLAVHVADVWVGRSASSGGPPCRVAGGTGWSPHDRADRR